MFFSKPYLASTELDDCAARRWRSKRLIAKIVCLRLLHILFDQQSEIHCNHSALGYVHKHVFGVVQPILTRFPNPLGAVVSSPRRDW